MRVGGSHFTYCLNVHPGETVQDIVQALRGPARRVKTLVCDDAPFGVGLRIAARAALELETDSALRLLRDTLEELDMYAFTVNAFPFGAFHGQPVKAAVYHPDWSSPERQQYTLQVARTLAYLLPDEVNGSISTVPLGYAPSCGHAHDEAALEVMAGHVLDVVATLWQLEQEGGKRLLLALEPEPDCLLQTIQDVVRVFTSHFFAGPALAKLATACGVTREVAVDICRRYLTVCLDACHAAVEFESPLQLLAQLRSHGILVGKVQLSSGLRVVDCAGPKRRELARFDEPVYLHQTVVRRPNGQLVRYSDLAQALQLEPLAAGEWRVHFHVPVHRRDYGSLSSTRGFLEELLAEHLRLPISEHLEVETYTWDVLPDKPNSLEESVAQELSWCLRQCR